VIISAAICPCPPLLARELTGQTPILPELRDACAAAVTHVIAARPDVIVVAGPGTATAVWDPVGRLELTEYAPGLRRDVPTGTGPGLPLALGIGALLLDAAGYLGPRVYQAVAAAAAPDACLRLGRDLAGTAPRVGLLTMGDGSARRTVAAPGYLDERAEPFDAAVERAVRDGDLATLAALDPDLAVELLVGGRPAWQVLAGALSPDGPVPGSAAAGGPRTEIHYWDAPLGVCYLVAALTPAA